MSSPRVQRPYTCTKSYRRSEAEQTLEIYSISVHNPHSNENQVPVLRLPAAKAVSQWSHHREGPSKAPHDERGSSFTEYTPTRDGAPHPRFDPCTIATRSEDYSVLLEPQWPTARIRLPMRAGKERDNASCRAWHTGLCAAGPACAYMYARASALGLALPAHLQSATAALEQAHHLEEAVAQQEELARVRQEALRVLEERTRAADERKRLAEIAAEERRRAKEERVRLVEIARIAEERRRAEEERVRLAEIAQEERRRAKEERARLAKIAQEERSRAAEERARIAEEERVRLAKIAEEERRHAEEERQRAEEAARVERERIRQERLAAEAAARRARAAEQAREDAAKMWQTVVLGSIATFGAGVDIRGLITGFECCTVCVKGLPRDAREDEVRAIFVQQGIDAARFQLVGIRNAAQGKEADIVMHAEAGEALAAGLDGIEFRDEQLTFEVRGYNSPGSMAEAEGRDSDVLTISWPTPSARYVVEYADVPAANAKVRELNRQLLGGRRVRAEMNTLPATCGQRARANFRPNSIKIYCPAGLSHEELVHFAGSDTIRSLGGPPYDLDLAAERLRTHIASCVPGALQSFDQSSTGSGPDGIVSFRARFSSWEDANTVHDSLAGKRFDYIGNTTFRLRLPSPMLYTIFIPNEQYRAQKAQWDSLTASIKDRKACTLLVHQFNNCVQIRVSGSVKQAIGALKVRVENVTRGEVVQGWHRALSGPQGDALARRILADTGAFMRPDRQKLELKLYGEAGAIEAARAMVTAELERLTGMDFTTTLQRASVSFFVRHGIAALKETFGEDSIRFVAPLRKLTVTGGEEARHAVARLIEESLSEVHVLPDQDAAQQACPICFDTVAAPVQLGCAHVYCTACLRHFLTSAADSDAFPLVCMGDEARCGVPIPLPMVQRFLPPAPFNRLLEVAFLAHIARHPREFKYCRTPDCNKIYCASDTATVRQCPACFATVCGACHEDAHEGMSCAEARVHKDPAEQERLMEDWLTQQGGRIKKCPECRVPIEKTEGCNHMSCKCGAHICWRCMGVFSRDTIYQHMQASHGGIGLDDEDVVLREPVDFLQQQELLRQAQANRLREEQRREQVQNLNRQFIDAERLGEVQRRENLERMLRERDARWERERRERELAEPEREAVTIAELARRNRVQEQQGWGCAVM